MSEFDPSFPGPIRPRPFGHGIETRDERGSTSHGASNCSSPSDRTASESRPEDCNVTGKTADGSQVKYSQIARDSVNMQGLDLTRCLETHESESESRIITQFWGFGFRRTSNCRYDHGSISSGIDSGPKTRPKPHVPQQMTSMPSCLCAGMEKNTVDAWRIHLSNRFVLVISCYILVLGRL